MKPRTEAKDIQMDLFRVELKRLVDKTNRLVILSQKINWKEFDELFGKTYDQGNGRSGIESIYRA